jgi:CheY-like chemotaxis protein
MAKFNSILLVEDDPITVMVCEKIIRMTDFSEEVQTKQNGHDALQHIQHLLATNSSMHQIIFLDINMPVMNGWDFLQEFETLKSQLPSIPRVFILSSTVDPEDRKRAAEFSVVQGFFSKPLTQENLRLLV